MLGSRRDGFYLTVVGPLIRKLALTTHVVAAVGWLGAVAAFVALAATGLGTKSADLARAAFVAMALVGWFVIVPLAIASLLTGLVQALGTPWGLARHYWVVMKLLITAACTVLVMLHMQPASRLASMVTDGSPFQGNARAIGIQLVADAAAAAIVLVAATALAVYKPKGLTSSRMPPWAVAVLIGVASGLVALKLLFAPSHF